MLIGFQSSIIILGSNMETGIGKDAPSIITNMGTCFGYNNVFDATRSGQLHSFVLHMGGI
jgi:hypothetical protein